MTVSNGVNLGRSLCDYELGIQILAKLKIFLEKLQVCTRKSIDLIASCV